jgi:hypothetical protein
MKDYKILKENKKITIRSFINKIILKINKEKNTNNFKKNYKYDNSILKQNNILLNKLN